MTFRQTYHVGFLLKQLKVRICTYNNVRSNVVHWWMQTYCVSNQYERWCGKNNVDVIEFYDALIYFEERNVFVFSTLYYELWLIMQGNRCIVKQLHSNKLVISAQCYIHRQLIRNTLIYSINRNELSKAKLSIIIYCTSFDYEKGVKLLKT